MLCILRYSYELREPKTYFEDINTKPESEAVGLAKELIESESGPFGPEKIPGKYAETLRELLRAKVEERAPHIEVATESKATEVINIMDALIESMPAKGRAKVRDAVRKRMGKPPKRRRQGRELHDHDQAHAGRRIEITVGEAGKKRPQGSGDLRLFLWRYPSSWGV